MKPQWTFLACGLALVAAVALQAADMKETARSMAEQVGKSVITIRVVATVKMNMQGQNREQEQKNEVTGVVVDPSGLTVACASQVEPSGRSAMSGMKIDITVKETTLILPDGTEVPADVVMKDTDLDMVFIRPKEAGKTFDAVALKPRAAQPKLLDDVFSVGRLGKEGNRAVRVVPGEIQAEVKGPRTCYVCSFELSMNMIGCLVFAADGEPIGILVTKTAVGGADGGGRGMRPMPIMRPLADLLDSIKQAKEAKPKPPEEKKEPAANPEEKK
ncbi:MAG: serine protease [Planctomycetota bacterium]|nr:serine protease [Planctomycetota bacterium]